MALACASQVRRLLLSRAGAPARFFHLQPYQAKVGAVVFLNGVGKGVDTHAAKVEEAVGGDLLKTRELPLKKADAPWKNVPRRRSKRSFKKVISSFVHWKAPAETKRVQ
ncbi:uncharacterized protein LOC124678798 [Lolium rigidum]|uniref:uncharacterized protein LOC124678798 n=1 Tax=Lolium rigidum TaxID=89674 RepID=UPI001F5D8DE5|nr:uncharacterized protein LOC124678798 [Lolium rigidum]XP_051218699.1 uncharacterized protein LOC127336000 [Lolium perenne]